jgi:hypothetical protein
VLDYALEGDENNFAVERKSLSDFVASIVLKENWDRELNKLSRARIAGITPIFYIVEASFDDLNKYPCEEIFTSGRVHNDFLIHRWRELEHNHDVHVIFGGDRVGAATAVLSLLKSRKEIIDGDKHAKHSPSALKNKEVCPCWCSDPNADYTAADEGTKLHAAMEKDSLAGLDEEQKAAVLTCMGYIRKLIQPGVEVFKENRLSVYGLTWGTADLLLYNRKESIVDVIDYKFGRCPVEDASTNLQGWCYVIGAMDRFRTDKARMTFILPRQGLVSEHTFKKADLPLMRSRIAGIIERAERAAVESADDPKICRRCGRAGWCRALAKRNCKALAKVGHDLPVGLDTALIEHPEQIAKLLNISPVIEHWLTQVKTAALKKAVENQPIPGYHLVATKGGRVFEDTPEILKTLGEAVTTDEFLSCCLLSVSKFDSLLKAKGIKTKIDEILKEKKLVKTKKDTMYLKKDEN